MTPLTNLLVESREAFLVHAGCVGPYDTDHRCSALHCDHCGACEMTPFVDSLIRKAYELGRDSGENRILTCVRGVGYDQSKVVALRREWDKKALDSAIGETKE